MYMSPEAITGADRGRSPAVDVWSLGCVILEMVTGRAPWANLDNEWAIMYHIAAGQLPQLPSPEQMSAKGIDFLTRCFERDARKRPTAAMLLQHEWILSISRDALGIESSQITSSETDASPLNSTQSSSFTTEEGE